MMKFNFPKESFAALSARLNRLSNNRHFRYGAPFIGLLLFGVSVIKNFAQIRYDAKKVKYITEAEIDRIEKDTGGRIRKRPREELTAEAIHEEYMKNEFVDTKDFEPVRGPRPWEQQTEEDLESEWEQKRRNNRLVPRPKKSRESYNI